MQCRLCPRNCATDRRLSNGYCRSGAIPRLSRAALHFWEEPSISGTSGSGAVFFVGCPLRCVYCQNKDISGGSGGVELTDDEIMRVFDRLVDKGAHNINLVTPTHFSDSVARILKKYKSEVPVVYNCSGYESVQALRELEGLVDIYLPDFKYACGVIARRYSNAPDYFEYACRAVLEMNRQVGTLSLDDRGIARRGLLVRHLVLPGAVENTKNVLGWIKDNLPPETAVSLMSQYTPCGRIADFEQLNRRLSKYEYKAAVEEMLRLDFENGYIQSRRSAQRDFIPDFDALEGLV